ncbi:hypothetical protein [Bdellovibrio sp.]|uniref:hypothetical protein n=1 Tax=Bdellovibrio sp. TaxID=28201 RepID=UPI0039E2E57E
MDFKLRILLASIITLIGASCSLSTSSSPIDSNRSTSVEEPAPTPSPEPTPALPPTPRSDDPAPPEASYPDLPTEDLGRENIGTKIRVSNLFDRWTLKSSVTAGRGSQYADVTTNCYGKIDLPYALTADQWKDRAQKSAYYQSIDRLIEKVGLQLITDRGGVLTGTEKQNFLKTLKALAWQESGWQHYVRYKNWFFVILSGGSYNVLDDWGITQVARSGFSASQLLNAAFFSNKEYCSIESTLYYGFTEYYDNYIEARTLSCNQTGNPMDKLLGAYNRYSSGFSACYNGLSPDSAYRTYQINAMNGLKTHYQSAPWLNAIN